MRRPLARILGLAWIPALFALTSLAGGCEAIDQGSGADGGAAGAGDGGAGADAATILGGGCGVEQKSGAQLCAATSQCPNVVVDTQAMPSCGFRIRGAVVDLVCACGTALCPMGVFTTCEQATQLLGSQTEQGVCVQVADGRCFESTSTTTSSSSSSSSTSSSGGNPACDKQCMKDCGGGEACASVCNCN